MAGLILKIILLLFFINIPSYTVAQEIIDLSHISREKFVIKGSFQELNKDKMKELLLVGIEISVNNIINKNTTRLANKAGAYCYLYLEIYSDITFCILEKPKYILVYDPIHPDAILNGNYIGYVQYPDIDIEQEYSDIEAMISILKKIK